MSVCVPCRRSVRSATTRSFSDLCIESPPKRLRPARRRVDEMTLSLRPHLGWTSADHVTPCYKVWLPAVFGDGLVTLKLLLAVLPPGLRRFLSCEPGRRALPAPSC